MNLSYLLDYFKNPVGKLYHPVYGHVLLPMGCDAGETKYLMLRYSVTTRLWSAARQATFINQADCRPAVGVTEEDLIALATKAWEESAS